MYVPRENHSHASNATMHVPKREHEHEHERFHIGRLRSCLPGVPIWLVLCVSALILASCDSTSSVDPTSSVDATSSKYTPTPQGHATWQMQLETAQKEAAKIDPEAVVHRIITTFTVAQVSSDRAVPVQTTFYFIRPNGLHIEILVEDTSPPRVVYVVPDVDTWNVKPSQADLQRYASLISNVKVGPRDLFEKIFDKNIKYAPLIGVSMSLSSDQQKEVGIANPWEINYEDITGEDLSNHTSINLWASPDTGEILKRDINKLSP